MNNYTAMDIANYIIWYVSEKQLGKITPLKLQKILYYVSTTYLKDCDELLFDEEFEKWQYGPVVTDVYHNFKKFGISHIFETVPTLIEDQGSFLGFKRQIFDVNIFNENDNFKRVAERVICKLIAIDAFDLVELTHEEKAWKSFETRIKAGAKELKYTKNELLAAKEI
jgi:uncharacterized phage-associated protein